MSATLFIFGLVALLLTWIAEYEPSTWTAEDDALWDYWIAKDAFERGDISADEFFGDERWFPKNQPDSTQTRTAHFNPSTK